MSHNVNPQITDSVTQVNTQVLGDAPAIAMGNLFMATSQALSNAAHNATTNEQQAWITMQAATTQAVAVMLSTDAWTTGEATQPIYAKTEPKAYETRSAASEASEPVTNEGELGVMHSFAHALQDLNEVAMRQCIYTVEIAAMSIALGQLARAQSPDEIAAGAQRLQTMVQEIANWRRSIDHHTP